MKLKSILQTLLFCTVLITTLVVGKNIYRNFRQVYDSQWAGVGVTCFFDMTH